MKPSTPSRLYLQQVQLSDICFLNEVLYLATFQRLPVQLVDSEGNDVRSVVMPGYSVDYSADHRLADHECEKVGLPVTPATHSDGHSA